MSNDQRFETSRSSKCIHPFNLNFCDEINRECVAESEVRELNAYSKKALQTSYNEIYSLKQKCQDQRNCIAELEAKLECMKSRFTNYNKDGDGVYDTKPSSDSMNDEPSSIHKSEKPQNFHMSRQAAQLSKIPILKLPFRVSLSRNCEFDTKIRSLSWKDSGLETPSQALQVKVNKSTRSFRQSFIRRPPSALQVSLRKQLESMERQKHDIIEHLLLKRNQKNFAEETLMRTVELHSQTLQILMQKQQEGKYSRPCILNESIKRFNAIQKQEHDIEVRISSKLRNVEVLEQVVKVLKSRKD